MPSTNPGELCKRQQIGRLFSLRVLQLVLIRASRGISFMYWMIFAYSALVRRERFPHLLLTGEAEEVMASHPASIEVVAFQPHDNRPPFLYLPRFFSSTDIG